MLEKNINVILSPLSIQSSTNEIFSTIFSFQKVTARNIYL